MLIVKSRCLFLQLAGVAQEDFTERCRGSYWERSAVAMYLNSALAMQGDLPPSRSTSTTRRTMGVLPVPPAVMLPTTTTGTGTFFGCSQRLR